MQFTSAKCSGSLGFFPFSPFFGDPSSPLPPLPPSLTFLIARANFFMLREEIVGQMINPERTLPYKANRQSQVVCTSNWRKVFMMVSNTWLLLQKPEVLDKQSTNKHFFIKVKSQEGVNKCLFKYPVKNGSLKGSNSK